MNTEENIKRLNEEIAGRFGRIEASLKAARSIPELFESLFILVEKEFSLPFVWLTLIDQESTASLLKAVSSSKIIQRRLRVMPPEMFSLVLPDVSKPVLVNRDLQPYYKLMPASRKYFVKSMAVVPFTFQNQTAGSWNNGDSTPERFAPDMETSLLSSLAGTLSQRLTALTDAV